MAENERQAPLLFSHEHQGYLMLKNGQNEHQTPLAFNHEHPGYLMLKNGRK
jgi:hypothetical protein